MFKYRGMKVFSSATSAWILASSILLGAPNDPSSVESVLRPVLRQRYDIRLDKPNILVNPLRLEFGGSSISNGAPFLLASPSNSPTVSKLQEQDSPTEESHSYLKPALYIGGALALTGIMIRTDQTTYDLLRRWRLFNDPLEDVSPAITNLGDGRASMAIFGGFLAYSLLGNDKTAFQVGKIGLESFLVSGIVTQILKHTFGRQRPSTATVSGGRWNGAYLLLNQGSGKRGGYAQYDAFPSGHTATIFAAATTLAEVYHDSPWVSYASYTVATSVAISRIMERYHWLSDCFVGGIIGYYSTQLVLHYNHSDKPVVLLPVYDGQNVGLALNVGF